MPFTQENKPLLEEAASINFQFTSSGAINPNRHTMYELGLYFIKKAVEVHGHRYGYKNVVYSGSKAKVSIVCRVHGVFFQNPNSHLRGVGCASCGGRAELSDTIFITRAKAIHGDKYDYSNVSYKNTSTKVDITCPIHGIFQQTPNSHLKGRGCPFCSRTKKDTTATFVAKAMGVHGNKYNYSLVDYVSSTSKISIICAEHGIFQQRPVCHLQGQGCPTCHGNVKDTTESFILKARAIHGDTYQYDLVDYINSSTNITIVCPNHGEFRQTPTSHLNFRGCPKCAGKNHNILYLLKCLDTGWYKIGITTDNIQKRLLSIGGELEEIHHVRLEDPRKHESILHNKYNDFNVYHDGVRNGNTEFFSLTEEQVRDVIDYMNEVSNER